MTRAPRSERRSEAEGPDKNWLKSTINSPSKGLMLSCFHGFSGTNGSAPARSASHCRQSQEIGVPRLRPLPESMDTMHDGAEDRQRPGRGASLKRSRGNDGSSLRQAMHRGALAVRQNQSKAFADSVRWPQTVHIGALRSGS